MIAALFGPLLALLVAPREATCPPEHWINGVRPDGRYECLLTRGDDDSPAIARTSGSIRCTPDEQPIVVDFRRARCRRRSPRELTPGRARRRSWRAQYDAVGRRVYRSHLADREHARARREQLRLEGLCINGRSHGPATEGVLCATCRTQHRRSS